MFLKYPIICSHVYCYSTKALHPPSAALPCIFWVRFEDGSRAFFHPEMAKFQAEGVAHNTYWRLVHCGNGGCRCQQIRWGKLGGLLLHPGAQGLPIPSCICRHWGFSNHSWCSGDWWRHRAHPLRVEGAFEATESCKKKVSLQFAPLCYSSLNQANVHPSWLKFFMLNINMEQPDSQCRDCLRSLTFAQCFRVRFSKYVT